ncbi:hypothetical protein ANO11243_094260 [Dothideomycetidae sp. 11243]|nr:hypothetical protein ANO11243_094260 [fungal sp. No.11243]
MAISYAGALEIVLERSHRHKNRPRGDDHIKLDLALGRTAAQEYRSPIATPQFDSSAMDGYAVFSGWTRNASPNNPITLRVVESVSAGDKEATVANDINNGLVPCVEIMTGARFPISDTTAQFDAVIPVERTIFLGEGKNGRLLSIAGPSRPDQHKRFAGEDFQKGDLILEAGQVITEQHVMALAQTGMKKISVQREVRIGLWSTGAELSGLSNADSKVSDVNGPYLTAILRSKGARVKFMGTLPDDLRQIEKAIRTAVASRDFDMLITTGGVSVGKRDFIEAALILLRAEIVFHGVAIRPGHPILFAMASHQPGLSIGSGNIRPDPTVRKEQLVAFFGLPGNPIAAAVSFEFLAMPYLEVLGSQRKRRFYRAKLIENPCGSVAAPRKTPQHDEFRHGTLETQPDGLIAWLSKDQSPAKVKPFLQSNCWVHLRAGDTIGAEVSCYPLESSRHLTW